MRKSPSKIASAPQTYATKYLNKNLKKIGVSRRKVKGLRGTNNIRRGFR